MVNTISFRVDLIRFLCVYAAMPGKTTAYSYPRECRLSASWGPNWGHPRSPLYHHSTIVMEGLKGVLIWATILPRDASLSHNQCEFFLSGSLHNERVCSFNEHIEWTYNLQLNEYTTLHPLIGASPSCNIVMVKLEVVLDLYCRNAFQYAFINHKY